MVWNATTPQFNRGLAMKTATQGQEDKLLSIFKRVSSERVQKLIESGLLLDLRDSDVSDINRGEFQKFVGLKFRIPTLAISFMDSASMSLRLPRETMRIVRNVDGSSAVATLELAALPDSEYYEEERWQNEKHVMEIIECAQEMGGLGEHSLCVLLEKQHMIPEAWRDFYLIFPGFVLEEGAYYVPYLYWNGAKWVYDFYYLSIHGWRSRDRLVRNLI
ncbi:MAG: hypothetical protein HYT22_00890 [Candidatus Niyogibacteria bacterium]|nr:hypothetical protein [Candidatus Niyogibacteria bacterium]